MMANYSFDTANQLTLMTPATGAPTTSTYDANGNLSLENFSGALTTFTWNGENRLTRVDNSDGTNEQMTYGADGLRRKRIAAGVTTLSVWDEQNVCMETNGGAATQAIYTDLPAVWGAKVSQRRSGTSHLYLPDFQGHIRQLAGTNQAIVDTLVANAWGEMIDETGSTPHPFREFGNWGYMRDVLGRDYVRARDLRVDLGRWISRDPIGFDGDDWNLYCLVSNSVVLQVDPSGLRCKDFQIQHVCPDSSYTFGDIVAFHGHPVRKGTIMDFKKIIHTPIPDPNGSGCFLARAAGGVLIYGEFCCDTDAEALSIKMYQWKSGWIKYAGKYSENNTEDVPDTSADGSGFPYSDWVLERRGPTKYRLLVVDSPGFVSPRRPNGDGLFCPNNDPLPGVYNMYFRTCIGTSSEESGIGACTYWGARAVLKAPRPPKPGVATWKCLSRRK